MSENKTGVSEFGLDMEEMVAKSWRLFLGRPFTFLGVACLIQVMWLPSHILGLPAFFWLPFTVCVPFATVQLLRGEMSDRIFMGWIQMYPRLLAVFVPATLLYLTLYVICGFIQMYTAQLLVNLPARVSLTLYWGRFFLPVLAESLLGHMLVLAALVSIRKKLSATDAILELFSTRRQVLEVFLLSGCLTLFGMSGLFICCIGVVATTAFAWICLGVAYYQMFEK